MPLPPLPSQESVGAVKPATRTPESKPAAETGPRRVLAEPQPGMTFSQAVDHLHEKRKTQAPSDPIPPISPPKRDDSGRFAREAPAEADGPKQTQGETVEADRDSLSPASDASAAGAIDTSKQVHISELAEKLGVPVESLMGSVVAPVKVNGEEQLVTLGAQNEGYQLSSAGRQALSEAANQRQSLEAERAALDSNHSERMAELEGLAEFWDGSVKNAYDLVKQAEDRGEHEAANLQRRNVETFEQEYETAKAKVKDARKKHLDEREGKEKTQINGAIETFIRESGMMSYEFQPWSESAVKYLGELPDAFKVDNKLQKVIIKHPQLLNLVRLAMQQHIPKTVTEEKRELREVLNLPQSGPRSDAGGANPSRDEARMLKDLEEGNIPKGWTPRDLGVAILKSRRQQ